MFYGIFVFAFLTLGYLGTKPPSPAATLIAQICALIYFAFFLGMPFWTTRGTLQAAARARALQIPLIASQETTRMKKWLSTLRADRGDDCSRSAWRRLTRKRKFALDRAPDNADNFASLQHGAQLFVNYCLNCHSANLMRYNRLTDLGIDAERNPGRTCCSRRTRSATR